MTEKEFIDTIQYLELSDSGKVMLALGKCKAKCFKTNRVRD